MEDIQNNKVEREEKINTMEKKKQKKKRAPTAWNLHLNAFREANPKMSLKEQMQKASKTYTPKKK